MYNAYSANPELFGVSPQPQTGDRAWINPPTQIRNSVHIMRHWRKEPTGAAPRKLLDVSVFAGGPPKITPPKGTSQRCGGIALTSAPPRNDGAHYHGPADHLGHLRNEL